MRALFVDTAGWMACADAADRAHARHAPKRRGRCFLRQRDKAYSFTDCTSLVVMRELRLREALTTDRHFRQMGFQVLP